MWTKILATYYKIKYWFSKERCYDEMHKRGYANERKCCGLMGGNGFTSYLNESCIDCPYLNLRQVNNMSSKNCSNCICSRIEYGFRTGWKYLYCMLDEPSAWRGGKPVAGNHVCKHWRNTK